MTARAGARRGAAARRSLVWTAWSLALACATGGSASAQLMRAPVTCTTCIGDYYYMDHGGSRDWACANSTYSGHTGSDYSLRNGNFAIDNDNEVVAMAAGTVVGAEDGYYDRCTQCGGANCGRGFGNGFANQVIIEHGPYRMIYGHMKMGSIAVQVGESVECGQVIGFVGSSGCSTGAHLHVEPSDAASYGRGAYTPIDPYAGDCSPTPSSLFVEQGAHRTLPGAACDDAPQVPACPADTYDVWTCDAAQTQRTRCLDGVVSDEVCEWGCLVMAPGTNDECAMPPDADGDGSRADVDCDDGDAALHPGAVEQCGDGLDQDCSGADEACPQAAVPEPTATTPSGTASAPAGVPQTGLPAASGAAGAAGALPMTGTLAPQSLMGQPVMRLPAPREQASDSGGCRVTPAREGSWKSWLVAWTLVVACVRVRRRRAYPARTMR